MRESVIIILALSIKKIILECIVVFLEQGNIGNKKKDFLLAKNDFYVAVSVESHHVRIAFEKNGIRCNSKGRKIFPRGIYIASALTNGRLTISGGV